MRFIILLFLLTACNPLVGVSSFVHSVATGNTVGIVTGGAGLAVEETTGKSVTEHALGVVLPKPKMSLPKPRPKQDIEWVTPK